MIPYVSLPFRAGGFRLSKAFPLAYLVLLGLSGCDSRATDTQANGATTTPGASLEQRLAEAHRSADAAAQAATNLGQSLAQDQAMREREAAQKEVARQAVAQADTTRAAADARARLAAANGVPISTTAAKPVPMSTNVFQAR